MRCVASSIISTNRVVIANCLLQGRIKSAATAAGRFVVNSTIGVAGLDDVASGWKMPKQVGDFGQTLWAWGLGEGPYLIVPVFGPETPRDGIGKGVDVYFDPIWYVPAHQNYPTALTTGRAIVDGVDQRARALDSLDEIERESIDYYASFRSLYRQHRAAELQGGKLACRRCRPPISMTTPAADPRVSKRLSGLRARLGLPRRLGAEPWNTRRAAGGQFADRAVEVDIDDPPAVAIFSHQVVKLHLVAHGRP